MITCVPSGFFIVTLTVAPAVPVPDNSSSVDKTVFLALGFPVTTGAGPLINFPLEIVSVEPSL